MILNVEHSSTVKNRDTSQSLQKSQKNVNSIDILRLQRSMLSKRLKRGVISAQPIGSKQNSKSVNSQGIGKKIQMDSIVISKKAM